MKFKMHFVLAALGLFLTALPALAHHSLSAEYVADDTKLITVTGVISKVSWINPHIYWYVDAKDESGKTVTWTFTNFPPSWWRRYGLSKDVFKVGDPITVEAYPAKDGTQHLGFGKIIHFADGRTVATMKGDPKDVK